MTAFDAKKPRAAVTAAKSRSFIQVLPDRLITRGRHWRWKVQLVEAVPSSREKTPGNPGAIGWPEPLSCGRPHEAAPPASRGLRHPLAGARLLRLQGEREWRGN